MADKKPVVETTKNDVQVMIDELVAKAQVALKEFMTLDQEKVDNIVHEMALAGLDKHQELARMAVEETGRGVYEDKVIKNMFATEYIWHDIKKERTVGILEENDMEGYVEVAEPVGVICGVTPTTHPPTTTRVKCRHANQTPHPLHVGVPPPAPKGSAAAALRVIGAMTPRASRTRAQTASLRSRRRRKRVRDAAFLMGPPLWQADGPSVCPGSLTAHEAVAKEWLTMGDAFVRRRRSPRPARPASHARARAP